MFLRIVNGFSWTLVFQIRKNDVHTPLHIRDKDIPYIVLRRAGFCELHEA